MRSRVLLVDDHPVVLEGICQLLATAHDFEVVAQATSATEALLAAGRLQPDLIVLDLMLPNAVATDICRELRASIPGVRVVILTAFDDRPLLRAALEAGASGILLKDVHKLDLVRALREIRAGRTVVDERVVEGLLVRGQHRADTSADMNGPLTPRECEVLGLIARGMTSKEIARALHLAPNTVRSYSQSLLAKLGAHNRIEALAAARRLRLI